MRTEENADYFIRLMTNSHRIYYLNYDITSYLVEGQNGIGVLLGNGWYNQNKERRRRSLV